MTHCKGADPQQERALPRQRQQDVTGGGAHQPEHHEAVERFSRARLAEPEQHEADLAIAEGGESLGLKNLQQRLRLLFGGAAGLKLELLPGHAAACIFADVPNAQRPPRTLDAPAALAVA